MSMPNLKKQAKVKTYSGIGTDYFQLHCPKGYKIKVLFANFLTDNDGTAANRQIHLDILHKTLSATILLAIGQSSNITANQDGLVQIGPFDGASSGWTFGDASEFCGECLDVFAC